MRSRRYAALKRGVDAVVGAVLLAVAAPVIAIACAAVLLESGMPLLHRRRVVGMHGVEFDAFKIRTMVRDADRIAEDDPQLRGTLDASSKPVADARVTRVGRWLRRTSIDELPQLGNVVAGQMSLVGPRMLTRSELPAWGGLAADMLHVRPGLTGLWQVSGRQRLSRDDRIRLDGEYLQRMSLGLDLRILLKTLPAVISGHGAL